MCVSAALYPLGGGYESVCVCVGGGKEMDKEITKLSETPVEQIKLEYINLILFPRLQCLNKTRTWLWI